VRQPEFDDPSYGEINPYALGFAMMRDIERICLQPEDEDRHWFPEIAGSKNPMGVLKDVWANYRDESFMLQFLSPRLMREWRMFHLVDNPKEPTLRVEAIHNEQGYRRVRQSLARHYDMAWFDPDIQVVDVDLAGDRRLELHHNMLNGILLQTDEAEQVLQHLADLWGYGIVLKEIDPATGAVVKEHTARARAPFC
jgi:spore cortex formation protein SpoVR/YcgB (stage V sporulation)